MTRKALGRGLGALIPGAPGPGDEVEPAEGAVAVVVLSAGAPAIADDDGGRERVRQIPLDRIVPNPKQPRIEFTEDALAELAESIRAQGVLAADPRAPGGRHVPADRGRAALSRVAADRLADHSGHRARDRGR